MSYGKRLKQLRNEKWWTLKEASQKLGYPSSTLGGYENEFRKPSLEILADIASKYNVSTDWILGLTDDRDIKKVESNVYEYFKKDGINWKGVPLTKEQLEPIEAILDMVIHDKLETGKKKIPKKRDHEKREHYI